MLTWLRSRSRLGRTASGLYGSIVAQARDAGFYRSGGVPDTMEGRFGMIAVHMFLVLERIRAEGDVGQALGRALLEAFMTDMDDNLREIGISDLGVPRRVKKAAAGLLEQLEAYRGAFAGSDDTALQALLARHALQGGSDRAAADLARYVRSASRHLAQVPWPAIADGAVTFPAAAV